MNKLTKEQKEGRLEIILKMKGDGKTLREIGEKLSLSKARVGEIIARSERDNEIKERWYNGLSVRAYRALSNSGCVCKEDVVRMIKEGSLSPSGVENFGQKTIEEIVRWAGIEEIKKRPKLIINAESSIKNYIKSVLSSVVQKTNSNIESVSITFSKDSNSVNGVFIKVVDE